MRIRKKGEAKASKLLVYGMIRTKRERVCNMNQSNPVVIRRRRKSSKKQNKFRYWCCYCSQSFPQIEQNRTEQNRTEQARAPIQSNPLWPMEWMEPHGRSEFSLFSADHERKLRLQTAMKPQRS